MAESGLCLHGTNTQIERFPLPALDGDGALDLSLDLSAVQAGDYTLSFALHSADHARNFHRLDHHMFLRVVGRLPTDGLVRLPAAWSRP